MKVRIRFSKSGALVYIGHLDVMRYFQKLFRRARISVAYSEGFSPHQILSFSPPLPLGMESEGEYADVTLANSISTEDALSRLRKSSVPEIGIRSFRALPDGCDNAMASVRAAEYAVMMKDMPEQDIDAAIAGFLAKDEITVLKKTKKNEKYVNIRELVYELSYDKDAAAIHMLISSGSSDNLKPQTVLEALFGNCGTGYEDDPYDIKRIDQYTVTDGHLQSLDDIGKDIT